jgi:hypothetical protein
MTPWTSTYAMVKTDFTIIFENTMCNPSFPFFIFFFLKVPLAWILCLSLFFFKILLYISL